MKYLKLNLLMVVIKKRIYFLFVYFFILSGCSSVHKEYYHDGTIMSECQMTSWQRNGQCKNYNRDGSLVLVEHYKSGVLEGECIEYYKTGKIKYRVNYKKGRLWDVFEYKDLNGSDLNYGSFKNGNGELVKYSDDGKTIEKGNMLDGLRDGYWQFYSNRGFFDSVLYKNGVREGLTGVETTF